MQYTEFFERFARSLRTKHLPRAPRLLDRILRRERRRGPDPTLGSRWRLPEASELPPEFIRLEPWEAEYLFLLASRAQKGIVETGRLHGGSTFLLACANPHVPIHSIDIDPKDDQLLKDYFARVGIGRNVELVVGDSQKGRHPDIAEIDLLFVDGDHSYAGCTADLENWFGNLVVGGHVVLHDCYFGCEVQPAVIDFIARHEVEVVTTPYIVASHWRHPAGSLAHFVKRG